MEVDGKVQLPQWSGREDQEDFITEAMWVRRVVPEQRSEIPEGGKGQGYGWIHEEGRGVYSRNICFEQLDNLPNNASIMSLRIRERR